MIENDGGRLINIGNAKRNGNYDQKGELSSQNGKEVKVMVEADKKMNHHQKKMSQQGMAVAKKNQC